MSKLEIILTFMNSEELKTLIFSTITFKCVIKIVTGIRLRALFS